jgi:uncharacterized membrane protein YcaP (DUF421 family)
MNLFDIKWMEVLDVIIRGLLSLFTLFFVTKMLGKKQVSQLSLFDYVIGISIGNFAAEMTINLNSQEVNGIVAVVLFGLIAYVVGYLTMKSIHARRFFMGVPTIIIQNGKILEKNMKRVKCDLNDVFEQLRTSGYFDVSQIDYAIMEANGEISILPKSEYRPVITKDMKLNVSQEGLVANVVMDSKIMKKNLNFIHKDDKWLMQQLKILGYPDLKKILLATVDINGKVVVYERNNNLIPLNVLE